MRCEICTNNPDLINLVPVPNSKGAYDTMMCGGCLYESDHYCHEHDAIHMYVNGNNTACGTCVEEVVREQGDKIAAEFAVGLENLKKGQNEIGIIAEFSVMDTNQRLRNPRMSDFAFATKAAGATRAQHLARPIVAYSVIKKVSIEDSVKKALTDPGVVFLGLPEEEQISRS